MPQPTTADEFLDLVRRGEVVEPNRLDAELAAIGATRTLPDEPKALAKLLVERGVLTYFQAGQLLAGKWRGFTVGKYQLLERLGSGGMGIVYLCEHRLLHRRVAVKFLPVALAKDPWFLESFYREGQAVAALDHPNIIRAHDIDQAGNMHFLVMEYVEGATLQEIVDKNGPSDPVSAAHYIRQAASGLQHAHERGLVHRDIKPDNLLLDRTGTVKILDMGLARFFHADQDQAVAKDQKKLIVGTDDYLAPEQIVNSDEVDIRADVYGLGATFYFLLTGRPPFHEVDMGYQKLIRHLGQRPKPIAEFRSDVPEAVVALVDKMMAKNPWDRFQTPAAVFEALGPWTRTPPRPPPVMESPKLSPAARLSAPRSAHGSALLRPGRGSSWVLPKDARGSTSQLRPAEGPPPKQAAAPDTNNERNTASGSVPAPPDALSPH